MSTRSPLLFLDIDGVLSPVTDTPPPGYSEADVDGARVVWSNQHREWLSALVERFEIVGATTWESRANATIGAMLELSELPAIQFGNERRGETWKLVAVAELAADRPCAWVDDRLFGMRSSGQSVAAARRCWFVHFLPLG